MYTIECDKKAWKHFDFSEIFVDFDILGNERLDQLRRLSYFNKYFTMEYINLLLTIWHFFSNSHLSFLSLLCKIVLVLN